MMYLILFYNNKYTMILHPFVKLLRFSKKYTVHRSHTKQIYKEI